MAWTVPSVSDFKAWFVRDFAYAPADDAANTDFVTDADITKALTEAEINFNPIYGTDSQCTAVFLYLAAFYLVMDLQNSAKGISSQSKFPINSVSVGGVSVSYQLPEKYAKDPVLAQYTQNGYGMKYLSLAMPFLVGNVGWIEGTTTIG